VQIHFWILGFCIEELFGRCLRPFFELKSERQCRKKSGKQHSASFAGIWCRTPLFELRIALFNVKSGIAAGEIASRYRTRKNRKRIAPANSKLDAGSAEQKESKKPPILDWTDWDETGNRPPVSK
jgi:hypothetical protein